MLINEDDGDDDDDDDDDNGRSTLRSETEGGW